MGTSRAPSEDRETCATRVGAGHLFVLNLSMRSNIGSVLSKRALLNPDNEALYDVSAGRRFTFRELNDRTNQVVNAITPQVKKGDRVALLMMNSHEYMTAFFAIAKIGGVVVPLNWRLVPDELEFILKDSGCTVLFYGEEFTPTVGELHSRGNKTDISLWIHSGSADNTPAFAQNFNAIIDPAPTTEPVITAFDDDLLYIMYTSGTTGLPKGVMHTHTTQMEALLTVNASSDYCIGDRYLNPMPLFHVGALTPAVVVTYRGLAHILMRSFDPVKVWELVRDEKICDGSSVVQRRCQKRSSRHMRKWVSISIRCMGSLKLAVQHV